MYYLRIIATMARWIPSGLSAISGQISNFTKEVLAEGIEEIDGTLRRVCLVCSYAARAYTMPMFTLCYGANSDHGVIWL